MKVERDGWYQTEWGSINHAVLTETQATVCGLSRREWYPPDGRCNPCRACYESRPPGFPDPAWPERVAS